MRQTVICIKWGTLYGPEYVNKLYSMVKRNTRRPLRFICFTDNNNGIDPEVEVRDLPPISLPPEMINKPWRKVSLWQRELSDLTGQVLFLDLDVVIVGSIDDFFDYRPESSFCVIHNWTTRSRWSDFYNIVGNTSCYRFEVGKHPYLYDNLQENPAHYHRKYRNSQTYISNEVSEITYWPDSWCVSFKHSLLPIWPVRLFVPASLPAETKLIAFTGKPDVHEAIAGIWPESNPFKKIVKRFVAPPWLEKHWS